MDKILEEEPKLNRTALRLPLAKNSNTKSFENL